VARLFVTNQHYRLGAAREWRGMVLLQEPAFSRAALFDPFLVEHGMIHNRALVRGENEVNLPVVSLNGHWVSVVVRVLGHVATPRPGLVGVR